MVLDSWRGPTGDTDDREQKIQRLVGIVPGGDSPIARTERVTFDYAIQWTNHRLIALDTRTWRRLVKDERTELIDTSAPFKAQVHDQLSAGFKGVSIVLSPPPVLGLKVMEKWIQQGLEAFEGAYIADSEPWIRSTKAFELLLSALAKAAPTVILSGDVHYAFSVRCEYWNTVTQKSGVIAQLVSSALKHESNEKPKSTLAIHQWAPGPGRYGDEFAGWNNDASNGNPDLWVDAHFRYPIPIPVSPYLKLKDSYKFKKGIDPAVAPIGSWLYKRAVANRSPDWLYRLELQKEWRELTLTPPPSLFKDDVTMPPVILPKDLTDKAEIHRYIRDVSIRHNYYLNRGGSGQIVVGVNNLGEVSFQENPELAVIHSLWWQPPKNGLPYTEDDMPDVNEIAMPFTSHRMVLQQTTHEAPVVEVEP